MCLQRQPLCFLLLTTILLSGCQNPFSGGQQAASVKQKKRPPSAHLVVVERVERRPSTIHQQRSGTLRARQRVRIFNQEEGRITQLPLFEGDRVKKGRLLARLEDDLLKAELDKARATTRQAQVNLKRIQRLVQHKATSEDELARAKTELEVAEAEQSLLETRISHTVIKAPFSGTISQRLVEPGDVVPRHTHLLTLIDLNSLITEILVSDLLIPQLKINDPVQVSIDGLGPTLHSGRILRIHPELDPKSRMGRVEILLTPNPKGARPGQLCRVTLSSTQQERLSVPFTALQRDTQGEYLFRVDSQQRAERVTVKSGLHLASRIEISQGIEPGDQVIIKGFLNLRDGSKIKVVEAP
ncbi:efflux RND transporter periplasmic adaptor subunit [endosymbiont of Ridgeia piscesae]|jgi:membrane fusion protein (multidrug efflux system)|uniref:Membrane fusion protein, multidrug efflux system n=1 Tax=endosymbiont of Ridgeia piscesae TaxID=54398 RepID=A0A0T5Z4L1_9GAMM|nr:efflux RND transporter periplasmic adaptor subunit [endosymbiont of Ridgeia piscesae]KRT53640.1 RND family efflux transporter, MFP subunit [endosymbiont of Ridgeia piscesae]KRT57510.1 membrane fusion protein, multidrug efflux system [endosymbiont of Ridgeia piscesae]